MFYPLCIEHQAGDWTASNELIIAPPCLNNLLLSRELILDHVRESQVVLIAGETGCGKTTQVPQYLLEESWGKAADL